MRGLFLLQYFRLLAIILACLLHLITAYYLALYVCGAASYALNLIITS